MIATSVILSGLILSPEIYFDNLPIVSVAHASVERFTGEFDYIKGAKDTDEDARRYAREYAIRRAVQQSGLIVTSESESENGFLKKDIINVVSLQIVNVISDKYKVIPIDDGEGSSKMRATVVVEIDTDRLNAEMKKFLSRDDREIASMIKRNEELEKNNEELRKKILQYENEAKKAKSTEEKSKVKNTFKEIKNNLEVNQKMAEGNKFFYKQDYSSAAESYTEALQIKIYTGVGEYYLSEFDSIETAKLRARDKAVFNAVEKAGVFIKSYSKSVNADITSDEISVISANLLEIIDVKYDIIPLIVDGIPSHMYRATVTAKFDTRVIEKWISLENATGYGNPFLKEKELEERKKQLEELNKKIAEAENKSNNK